MCLFKRVKTLQIRSEGQEFRAAGEERIKISIWEGGAPRLSQPTADKTLDLKSLSPEDLERLLVGWGEPAYRARQIMEWMFQRGAKDFSEMTNLPLALRDRLAKKAYIGQVFPKLHQQSADGTEKFLFELADGVTVESVLIPEGDRLTACISSQAGCGIGCSFCATAIGGLIRNLTAAEIVDQLIRVQRHAGKRINNVVLMGMGEPLANYGPVMRAVRAMNHPLGLGLGQRNITISTSGIVPAIRRLADEDLQVVLAVSLHAPTDELRDELVPLNRKYPVAALLDACRDYVAKTGRRITIEYVLIRDVNDSIATAQKLVERLELLQCHVNLIPLNPVPETGYERPDAQQVRAFADKVREAGIPVTVRKEKGSDIDAACGQLRRQSRQLVFVGE